MIALLISQGIVMADAAASGALLTAQRDVDAAYALLDDVIPAGGEEERTTRMALARDRALAAVEAAEAAEDAVEVATKTDRRSVQARLLYLRGKATASSDEGRLSTSAERHLSAAVKLDPSLLDAWNCLGECFWARGALELARHTFQAALEHDRNAATLRHLSMLLRALSQHEGAVETLLAESVSLAKESVRLDTSSAKNWAGLGAAHLSLHVHVSSEAEDLHLAHRAFKQAVKVAERVDATILVNHATVLAMLDGPLVVDAQRLACKRSPRRSFLLLPQVLAMLDGPGEALRLFTTAHDLDPSLGALHKRADVWAAVSRCGEAINLLSGSKGLKRLSSLVADLPVPLPGALPPTPLSSLAQGENPDTVILVKVIVAVPLVGGGPVTGLRHHAAHQTLVVADATEQLMALTLYAVRGLPVLEAGATLEIREPFLVRIEASPFWQEPASDAIATGAKAPVAGYNLLRVERPTTQLRIDGGVVRSALRTRPNSLAR